MSEHVCHCQNCDPGAFPLPPEREGERHLSTRFDDHDRGYCVRVYDAAGNEVTHVWELWAGEGGTVYRCAADADGKVHGCARCYKAPCSEVRHGFFRVAQQEWAVA